MPETLLISVAPKLKMSNKGIESWVYEVGIGVFIEKDRIFPLGVLEIEGNYTKEQLGNAINRVLEDYKKMAIRKPFTVEGETFNIPEEGKETT